jgi:hypothetical protein
MTRGSSLTHVCTFVGATESRGASVKARPHSILLVIMLVIGTASSIGCDKGTASIELECPSPSGRLVAVFWGREGGGTLGWAESFVTILHSGTPVQSVERTSRGRVFNFRHAFDLRLIWKTDDALQIEYPDSADVEYAVSTNPLPGLSISYRSAPAKYGGVFPEGSRCESGGRIVAPPPPRVLRER